MRDILAYCTDARLFGPGVRYAAELAAGLDASLNAIHVSAPIPLSAPPGTPPSLLAEFVAYAQDEVQAAMQAGSRFTTWARQLGVRSSQWQVALGSAAGVLGAAANWNDVVVIERRIGMREDLTELISEMLLSGFACISVPEATYSIGRLERIAIAFNGSPASIRALHAALPMLRRATHVILLEGKWGESAADDGASEVEFDPVDHLRRHGVAAEVERIDPLAIDIGDALLEAASKNRADLIVAGTEGKRRHGDSHLAAVPKFLLRYAGLPLFMAQ